MDNQSFDSIMRGITSGLTGNSKADLAYLQEQMEKYKDHEMSKEILRACGRIVYELLPDESKAAIGNVLEKNTAGVESALEEVRFNMYKKNYTKALKIIEALAKKVEDLDYFKDDHVSEYHVFDEPFEEVLYCFRTEPEKKIRIADISYTEIYFLYGCLLVEMKRLSGARDVMEKGLRWNPVCFKIMTEYIETYKMERDLEKFFSLSLEAFQIAFRPKDVARCYRNLGYYFVEKELYSEAIAVYRLSLLFDSESNQAQSELYFINEKTGGRLDVPSHEALKGYAEKYGFPIGADPDVLGIAIQYGKHYIDDGDSGMARYFLSIAYELTRDDAIKEVLEHISDSMKGSV